jgi:hypothetical protein
VTDSSFQSNAASAGNSLGGSGGGGGWPGDGGAGGAGYYGNGGDGGNAGLPATGGNSGAAGVGGNQYGGAIYSTGTIVLARTDFTNNYARGGGASPNAGGSGGDGRRGGSGGGTGIPSCGAFCTPPPGADLNAKDGACGLGTNGGDGGTGHGAGPGSIAEGGAVYSTTPFSKDAGTTSGNFVVGYDGQWGGGGFGGRAGSTPCALNQNTFTKGKDGCPCGLQQAGPGTSLYPDYFPDPSAATPDLSVANTFVYEPDTGTVDAELSVALATAGTNPVTVSYATADGTATTAAGDYKATSGTLTFAPGETVKKVLVTVLAHPDASKGDKNFTFSLTSESGATVSNRTATVNIRARHLISGHIVDHKGRPVAGATVNIKGRDPHTVITDQNGAYAAKVIPGDTTVVPQKPVPGQPSEGGAFEPKANADCHVLEETCVVNLDQDRVADFAYVFKVPVKGQVVDVDGKAAAGVKMHITGTDDKGHRVDTTTLTNPTGAYSQLLSPGTYLVVAGYVPGAKHPATYIVTACEGKKQAGGCFVTIDRTPVIANFKTECETTVDFKTDMIAQGCFIRLDPKGKRLKAKGSFRLNGLDFEADHESHPVVFDREKKTVTGPGVTVGVSWGTSRYLVYHLGPLSKHFAGRTIRWTLALGRPAARFTLGGTASATLFGFPVHAPAMELESTAGRTSFTIQLSGPPGDGAILDKQVGLWKMKNENGQYRIAYPSIIRGAVAVTNSDGLTTIEGSFSPSGIFTFGAHAPNGKAGFVPKGTKPVAGMIELAAVKVKYDFPNATWRFGGTVVLHLKPGRTAPLPFKPGSITRAIGTNSQGEGFLGALIFEFELSAKPSTSFLPNRIILKVNGINKLIYPPWFLYLQRLGIDIGRDTDQPGAPLKLALNGGLTWGPRIRSDLWFQELASLDIDGGLQVSGDNGDVSIFANGILRGVGARVLSVRFLWNLSAWTAEVAGEMSVNLREIVSVLPKSLGDISLLGTGRLSFPAQGGWHFDLDGTATLAGYTGGAKFRADASHLGLCLGNGAGLRWEGGLHLPKVVSCDFAAYEDRPAADHASRAGGRRAVVADAGDRPFTVAAGTTGLAVAVRGVGSPPSVSLIGPAGEVVSAAGSTLQASPTVMVLPDDATATTYIYLIKPAAGTYLVRPAPGSAAVASVGFGRPLPAPVVRARVTGTGCGRRLSWTLAPLPGQTVVFSETGAQGTRELVTTAAARGSVAFLPRPGGDRRRTITALVEQAGAPRASLTLASFTAGPSTPAAVRGLRAQYARGVLSARWTAPCYATAYAVEAVSGRSDIVRRVRPPRFSTRLRGGGRQATLTVVPLGPTTKPSRAVTVRVRAR